MNSRQVNFAYKVRHALNENLESVPAPAVLRLAEVRRQALARRKKETGIHAFVTRAVLATAGGASGRFHPWLATIAALMPAMALVAGLTGIYQFEQQRRIADTAEIDAEMLADELPLSAYLDRGFDAYLATQGD